jgi:hypothetical protein
MGYGVGEGVGVGIGQGLQSIAQGLTRRWDAQASRRDKQAEELLGQAKGIAANRAQIAAANPQDPRLAQLDQSGQALIKQANDLYVGHEKGGFAQLLSKTFGHPGQQQSDRYNWDAINAAAAQPKAAVDPGASEIAKYKAYSAAIADPKTPADVRAKLLKDLGAPDPNAAPPEQDWKPYKDPYKPSGDFASAYVPDDKRGYVQMEVNPQGKIRTSPLPAGYQPPAAKEEKPPNVAEGIKRRVAAELEKGPKADRKVVAQLQGELKAIDPEGAQRIQISLDNQKDREDAERWRKAEAERKDKEREAKPTPIQMKAETAFLAASQVAAQADIAASAKSSVQDKLLIESLVKAASARYSQASYENVVGKTGLGNKLEQFQNNVLNGGVLPDDVRQQAVAAAHALRDAAAEARKAVATPAAGGAQTGATDPVEKEIQDAIAKHKQN